MKKLNYLLLSILLFSVKLSANVPAPFQGGYAGFEPSGLEKFVSINEKIFIDMTNLGAYADYKQDNNVNLENSFEFENPQTEQMVALSLPFGDKFQVFLDDTEVSVKTSDKSEETPKWKIPNETNWFDGKKLAYRANNNQAKTIQIKVPTGKHVLKIKQKLNPSYNLTGVISKYWQFSFVFLPPELRKNIYRTEIEIKTPQGWQTFISPELKGENDVWKGTQENLSADAVTITTRMPKPENYDRTKDIAGYFLMFLFFGFPIICLILCGLIFAKYQFGWTGGFVFSILWSILLVITMYFHEFSAKNTVPLVQQVNYGYDEIGSFIAIVMFGIGGLVLGFPLWLLVWFLVRKFFSKP